MQRYIVFAVLTQIWLLQLALLGGVDGFAIPVILPLSHYLAPSSTALFGRAAFNRRETRLKVNARKTKINAMYGRRIQWAVKEGGGSGDPHVNRILAHVIQEAKSHSVPVDNINNVIKRAVEGSGRDIVEAVYEAYGFGGVSLIVNVLTDSRNRASSEIKSLLTKKGAKWAETGSVLFLYQQRGKVVVPAVLTEDDLLGPALEADLEDFQIVEGSSSDSCIVYVDPTETAKMYGIVESLGHSNARMSLCHVPSVPMECSEEDSNLNIELIDALDGLDDVSSVEHNMILPPDHENDDYS
eukprot:Nitzschia sp. Nitz4//scaffold19_size178191//127462//128433//NITZ4_001997-RA/size178191-augustus-gene-0.72-mRNA-1//1//CDS//3329540741//8663//frame0